MGDSINCSKVGLTVLQTADEQHKFGWAHFILETSLVTHYSLYFFQKNIVYGEYCLKESMICDSSIVTPCIVNSSSTSSFLTLTIVSY